MHDLQGFIAALRVGGAMIYPLLLLAVVAVIVILEQAFVFVTRTRLPGAEGLVDPRGVTGGVAEALIATAVGLFIAMIALFAFNYFSHRQAEIMDEMEQLGTRVVDSIRLEEKG